MASRLAHPTLTWNSYFAHLFTLRNAGTRLRYTNFVELMPPLSFGSDA
jgi:hypothetical protein